VKTRITGRNLASERTRLGLRQSDVAGRMNVSRSRVSHAELLERVPDSLARRYLDAIGGDAVVLLKLEALLEELGGA
jgi:transcriptional regulator with XRE-family HTH domain